MISTVTLPEEEFMRRFVATITVLLCSLPALADDAACEKAGKQLHAGTELCLSSSAMWDTCVDQKISSYGNTVRRIEGGCDDTGKQLKDCLVTALKTDRNDKGPVETCLATWSYD
jgi:hypothetical protein